MTSITKYGERSENTVFVWDCNCYHFKQTYNCKMFYVSLYGNHKENCIRETKEKDKTIKAYHYRNKIIKSQGRTARQEEGTKNLQNNQKTMF